MFYTRLRLLAGCHGRARRRVLLRSPAGAASLTAGLLASAASVALLSRLPVDGHYFLPRPGWARARAQARERSGAEPTELAMYGAEIERVRERLAGFVDQARLA